MKGNEQHVASLLGLFRSVSIILKGLAYNTAKSLILTNHIGLRHLWVSQ